MTAPIEPLTRRRNIYHSQTNLPVRLETALDESLGRDFLSLVGFDGVEGISMLFEYVVEATSRGGLVDFSAIVGTPARVVVDASKTSGHKSADWPTRYFHGIVRSVDEIDADPKSSTYRIVIAPRLWLLSRNRRFRVFQNKSIAEILRTVLARLNVDYRLKEEYAPYDYCVQYGESDFHFVSRLMEEEGIFYFFEQGADGHRLVIADRSIELPELVDGSTLPYTPEGDARREGGKRIDRFRKRQEIEAGDITMVDDCFELSNPGIRATTPLPAETRVGAVQHRLQTPNLESNGAAAEDDPQSATVFQYPAGFANRFDRIDASGAKRSDDIGPLVSKLAQRSADLEAARRTLAAFDIRGESPYFNLCPGRKFELSGHPTSSGNYLLTEVRHHYSVGGENDGELDIGYRNSFVCIPAETRYRPMLRTPRPRADGSQTATVVAHPDNDVTTDPYGRVKVRFHWSSLSENDLHCSCWVRVAQTWAGNGWGALFLPRKGHEVVVDFLNGDPNRPIIIGGVYNESHRPPVELPAGRHVSGIMSRSHSGDRTEYNGLKFGDANGKEEVHLRSQGDMMLTCKNDLYLNVPNDLYQLVAGEVKTHFGVLTSSKPPAPKPPASEKPLSPSNGKGGGDSNSKEKSLENWSISNFFGNFLPNHGKWWHGIEEAAGKFDFNAPIKPKPSFDMTCKFGGSVNVKLCLSLGSSAPGKIGWMVDPIGMASLLFDGKAPAGIGGDVALGFLGGATSFGKHGVTYGAADNLKVCKAFKMDLSPNATKLNCIEGKYETVFKVGMAAHAISILAFDYVTMIHGSTTPRKWLLVYAGALHGLYLLTMAAGKVYASVTKLEKKAKEIKKTKEAAENAVKRLALRAAAYAVENGSDLAKAATTFADDTAKDGWVSFGGHYNLRSDKSIYFQADEFCTTMADKAIWSVGHELVALESQGASLVLDGGTNSIASYASEVALGTGALPTNARIVINADGISLKYGVTELKISKTEIELTAGPAAKLKLGPGGIAIEGSEFKQTLSSVNVKAGTISTKATDIATVAQEINLKAGEIELKGKEVNTKALQVNTTAFKVNFG